MEDQKGDSSRKRKYEGNESTEEFRCSEHKNHHKYSESHHKKRKIEAEFKNDQNSTGAKHQSTYTQQFVKAQEDSIQPDDIVPQESEIPKPKLLEDLGIEKWDKKATKMMLKTGYIPGTGLGSSATGIEKPVDAGRDHEGRGLGFVRKLESEPVMTEADFKYEDEQTEEKEVKWIPHDFPVDINTIISGHVVGEMKYVIDDETHFCEPTVLKEMLRLKTLLDEMKQREKLEAVTRSNPYETIKKGIFINRAAMKMANIDSILNFKLTNFQDINYDLLYFADVCAGPGGFSEYVLYRKGWLAKGFGFTLKGDCDFKLGSFKVASTESFEAIYGPDEKSDGNVYNPINVKYFVEYVKDRTHNLGVHFMLADGGFSVQGQENIQEILSHQIYLSQCLVALSIVRTGGHFICKLFDVFTPFSVGLVYLFYLCFEKVALHKPVTSRPANSERYIYCINKLENDTVVKILGYLQMCHKTMWDLLASERNDHKQTIVQLVDLSVLKNSDSEFFNYMYESNNSFGKDQIDGLKKIIAFHRDKNLKETRQWDTRRKFLLAWKITDGPLIQNECLPDGLLNDLLDSSKETNLTLANFKEAITSPYYWMCIPFECPETRSSRTFYKSNGRSNVLKYDVFSKMWKNTFAEYHIRIEMPKDTLVYGEIVFGKSSRAAFYIIDGFMLGGKDIRRESFEWRNKICQNFAESVCKKKNDKGESLVPIRVKSYVQLGKEYLPSLISRLQYPADKRASEVYCPAELWDSESPHYKVSGLLFLKFTADPWIRSWSNSQQKLYFYNTLAKKSFFEPPPNVYTEFKYMMSNRLVWYWNKPLLLQREIMPDQNTLNYQQLFQYLQSL